MTKREKILKDALEKIKHGKIHNGMYRPPQGLRFIASRALKKIDEIKEGKKENEK